jgi:hypothetical protein
MNMVLGIRDVESFYRNMYTSGFRLRVKDVQLEFILFTQERRTPIQWCAPITDMGSGIGV